MPDYDLAAEDALPLCGDLLCLPVDPLAAVAVPRQADGRFALHMGDRIAQAGDSDPSSG
jgi:hypothetical protein